MYECRLCSEHRSFSTRCNRCSARHIYSSADPLFCRERATDCHDPLYPDVALASSSLTLLSKRSLKGRTRPLAPLPSRTRNCIRARSMSLVLSCVASEIRSPQRVEKERCATQGRHPSFAPLVCHSPHGKRCRTTSSAALAGPFEPKDYGALPPCDSTQASRGALAFGSHR